MQDVLFFLHKSPGSGFRGRVSIYKYQPQIFSDIFGDLKNVSALESADNVKYVLGGNKSKYFA